MATYGEVYTTIDASVVSGGISTLSTSGTTQIIGVDDFTIVIMWQYDPSAENNGITGKSWFANDPVSPMSSAAGTDENFNELLATMEENGTDIKAYIDGLFADWTTENKVAFYNKYVREGIAHSCTSAIGN